MDGTGRLFEPFIEALDENHDILTISLPGGQDQSYEFLTQYVRKRLPRDDRFIILAESFSGPIAYRLLQEEENRIATVIFVASFIKRPTLLAKLASRLVASFMLRRSLISDIAVKTLLLGFRSNQNLMQKFWQAVTEAGARTLKSRLEAVGSLPNPEQRISKVCFYIQADNDCLVPGRNFDAFKQLFVDIRLYRIEGPHLILQTKPRECAAVIGEIARNTK